MVRPGLLVAILAALAALAPQSAAQKPIEGCFGFGTYDLDKAKNVICRSGLIKGARLQNCISQSTNYFFRLIDDFLMDPYKVGDKDYFIITDYQEDISTASVLAFEIDKCDYLMGGFELEVFTGISFSDDPKKLNPKPPKEALQLLVDFIKNDGVVLSPKIAGLTNDSGSLSPLEVFFIILASVVGCQAAVMFMTRNTMGWDLLKSPEEYWINLYKTYL